MDYLVAVLPDPERNSTDVKQSWSFNDRYQSNIRGYLVARQADKAHICFKCIRPAFELLYEQPYCEIRRQDDNLHRIQPLCPEVEEPVQIGSAHERNYVQGALLGQGDAHITTSQGEAAAAADLSDNNPNPPISVVSTSSASAVVSPAQNYNHLSQTPSPLHKRQRKRSSTTTKRRSIYTIDRKAICEFYNANPGVHHREIAAKWGISRSAVSRILAERARWLATVQRSDIKIARASRMRSDNYGYIEGHLMSWINDMHSAGLPVTNHMIRVSTRFYGQRDSTWNDSMKLSSSWMRRLKRRLGIVGERVIGEGKGCYLWEVDALYALPGEKAYRPIRQEGTLLEEMESAAEPQSVTLQKKYKHVTAWADDATRSMRRIMRFIDAERPGKLSRRQRRIFTSIESRVALYKWDLETPTGISSSEWFFPRI
ncbi:hypothetical protein WOLCODRAFT_138050 [Wolfiporia cocos MD-104 SS10]|uniref:HTH CENPB-type domain-containing protein n=1 Tax=Wolfiporia cocos (strain MD-104) TaxID=742152 RepID=A0A2H3JV18_WOLCO|nr:hypothetical protein WOLCODRAFT_138050 [Wolfiporia cocos MD-104 SS10]